MWWYYCVNVICSMLICFTLKIIFKMEAYMSQIVFRISETLLWNSLMKYYMFVNWPPLLKGSIYLFWYFFLCAVCFWIAMVTGVWRISIWAKPISSLCHLYSYSNRHSIFCFYPGKTCFLLCKYFGYSWAFWWKSLRQKFPSDVLRRQKKWRSTREST